MHGHDYSNDYDAGGILPAAALRSRGGWEDTNQLRLLPADGAPRRGLSQNHAAVDLSQFRNEEVGKGYKAKHVVRQKDASATVASVVDMSGGKFSKPDAKRNCHGSHKNNESVHHGSYLESKGIRDFLKEIDEILNPSTKGHKDSVQLRAN